MTSTSNRSIGSLRSFSALLACACALGMLFVAAADAAPVGEKSRVVIKHSRIKPIVWKCADREREVAEFANARSMDPSNPQALLLSATRNKPIPNAPLASLGWMDMNLRPYGNTIPLTTLQGEARTLMLQIATLVNNDYTIAAKMAHSLAVQSPSWPKDQGLYVSRLVQSLTDSFHDVPELAITNAQIEQSWSMIESQAQAIRPSVRGYARWAIHAFAYDDDVAIDVAMTGMCQAKPTAAEKGLVEKAIKASQFRP